jgi:hypothetical protein
LVGIIPGPRRSTKEVFIVYIRTDDGNRFVRPDPWTKPSASFELF